MEKNDNGDFTPTLTVLPEDGNIPFLWRVSRSEQGGVGGNVCDGMGWDESMPLSEGLFLKFVDWVLPIEEAASIRNGFDADWDWVAFHARGLQLANWLKDEVGNTHRVVYQKSWDDPNHGIDERREILADGSLQALPALSGSHPSQPCFCRHIVSGGQTGADRAALDFAIEHGYTHGGWAPHGRRAEDGRIPVKYQLVELPTGGYRERTRRNVEDSDATLIVNLGELDGGTLATQRFADSTGKPCYVAQVDDGISATMVTHVLEWLRQHDVDTLNVAGPRESKRPGIYKTTLELLQDMLCAVPKHSMKTGSPRT